METHKFLVRLIYDEIIVEATSFDEATEKALNVFKRKNLIRKETGGMPQVKALTELLEPDAPELSNGDKLN